LSSKFLSREDRITLALWYRMKEIGKTNSERFRDFDKKVQEIKEREWLSDEDMEKIARECYEELTRVQGDMQEFT